MALVAAYRMDEEGEANREGQVGSEPDLAASSGIDDVAGLLGLAAKSPGGFTPGIRLQAGSLLSLAALRSFSLSFWVKIIDPGFMFGNNLRLACGDPVFYATCVFNTSGAPNFAVGDGLSEEIRIDASGAFTTGEWTHCVVTWNNATGAATFYVDGALVGTDTNGDIEATADFDTFFLEFDRAEIAVDMLCIYDEVIGLASGTNSVTQLYNSGAGFDPTDAPATASGAATTIYHRFLSRPVGA